MINIIACLDKEGAIGHQNQLLFHLRKDMERFRLLTTGHTIIMGRKTYESLPHGALPHRRNIVISHDTLNLKDCTVCHSLEEALVLCEEDLPCANEKYTNNINKDEVFIIGGASIYKQALPLADRMYLTIVDKISPNADTYFPKWDEEKWMICCKKQEEEENKDTKEKISFSFILLERNK